MLGLFLTTTLVTNSLQENVTCDFGQRPCANREQCVPLSRLCNREKDCEDGSDEGSHCSYFDCGDGSFI